MVENTGKREISNARDIFSIFYSSDLENVSLILFNIE